MPPQARRAPKEFRGIGIRIEDDVVVTGGEAEVLSEALVKEADALEAFMRGS